MPKGRYALMTRYMKAVGSHGTQMMYRTCTVQVNLDFASEADMVKKFRVSLALQPLATALFANSPFFDGKPNGWQSWRARIWQDTDPARTGMLPFVFEDGMSFERYVDYALDVPMYFVYRDGRYIDALGQSFRDFLAGRLPALPGEKPTFSDWADHLTTIFPEVRLKKFMEMRGADGGPVAPPLRPSRLLGRPPLRRRRPRRRLGALQGLDGRGARPAPPRRRQARAPRRDRRPPAPRRRPRRPRHRRGRPQGPRPPRRRRPRRRRDPLPQRPPRDRRPRRDRLRRAPRPLPRRLGRRPHPHLRRVQLLNAARPLPGGSR